MCGIGYFPTIDLEKIKDALEIQIDRGTDSFGYFSDNMIFKIDTQNVIKDNFPEFSKKYISLAPEERIVWHTRKSSVGNKDVANAHPHKIGKYVIVQNGTERKFIDWAQVHFLDNYIDGQSDTHYLLEYIISKGEDTAKTLTDLIKSNLSLGAVMLYDTEKGNLIFATDAARTTYVELDDTKEYIKSISSEAVCLVGQTIKTTKKEYKNTCVIEFDPKTGKIIKMHHGEIENKQEVKTQPVYQYTYSYQGTAYTPKLFSNPKISHGTVKKSLKKIKSFFPSLKTSVILELTKEKDMTEERYNKLVSFIYSVIGTIPQYPRRKLIFANKDLFFIAWNEYIDNNSNLDRIDSLLLH